ncbi:hypothetical protein NB640_01335 [Oxalobacter vibrioformis]|uniref:Lipoprotein n=1 Tax=Oxalobacter vibrioformis TaxID=933080 RepID=A0A9E9LX61_9BURK|nr:hypothetical protein [Oxalobacter vibrioformis]WAW10337.1 hypothetical protein NB640_01335 [Oxalobacter vibrioformis]
MLRAIFLFSMMLLLAGCASRVPTDTIRSSLSTGYVSDLREKMEKNHDSFGEFVTALNLARLLQIEGRWKDSIQRYDEALTILEEYESRAIINVREIAATAGTFLLARGTKQYYGTGYERSLLHTFNSMNYLMLGDFTGAAVEMRKMDKRQEYWLQESESRIEKNMKETMDLPVQYSMRDMLEDEAVRKLMNNYQDPFSYALSSIVFRITGDIQASGVNLRRAVALDSNAGELFRHAWPQPEAAPPRKGKTAKKEEEERIVIPQLVPLRVTSVGSDAPALGQAATQGPERQEVTVIALSGVAPSLKIEHIRVSFPRIGYILLDLPSYTRPVPGLVPHAAVSHAAPMVFYPLLRTDRLAYRTLQDEVNLEMGSAVSRAAVRAGISASVYAGARSNEDTRDYAEVASTLTMILLDLWTYSMSDSARNWETLPNEGYIAMATVPNGSTITVGEGKNQQNLPLPNDIRGVIIMMTYFSNSHMKMDYVTY